MVPDPWSRRKAVRAILAIAVSALLAAHVGAQTSSSPAPFALRGRIQPLHLYGSKTAQRPPVIVSSGDGGWIHLGPHVAQLLAAQGFFVVGFDVRAYLESFTTGRATLAPDAEQDDYRALAEYAGAGPGRRALFVGVSEGAGLSVLAAADPHVKPFVAGVIGCGLPDVNELGWRWRDALIYLTHGVPNEPTFSAAAVAGLIAPVPLAMIHSTHDEYVPNAETERVYLAASEPKRAWTVPASDHRFSDNLPAFDRALVEAIDWAMANQPR